MRTTTLRNVARNAMRPHYLPVMVRKVAARLRPSHRDEALRWAESQAESVADFAMAIDADLWTEAEQWAAEFWVTARQRLDQRAVPLRGGGDFQLVHFLVRHLQPRVVLETGVAAGFTSQAILSALERNDQGSLFSSDFPYFRLEAPEQYVGCLVDDALRPRWHLELNGDRVNLAAFGPALDQIDLVHYDSDKSVEGREFVIDAIASKLSAGAVVVMDDVDDNTYFRDWVARTGADFHVFQRGPKYVGLVGL